MSYFNLKSAFDDTVFRVDIATWSGVKDGVRLPNFARGTDIVALLSKDVNYKKPNGGSITYYVEVTTGYADGPTISYSTVNQTLRVQGDSHVYTNVITLAKQYMIATPPNRKNVTGYCGASSRPGAYNGDWNTIEGADWLGTGWNNIVVRGGGGGAGGPTSKPGGGGGSFDNTNDDVFAPDYTNNPIAGMIAAGTIGVYVPTKVQMAQFSHWLWSADVYDVLVKLKDPMDYIIKLGIIPVEVTQKKLSGFSLGTVFSQDFQMYKSLTQIVTYDLGTIAIPEYWGNALDYAPNTRIQIFLPFIGYQNLQTDDVMGASINLKYNIDIITGACVAIVTVTKGNISQVLYQFNGQCMMSVPLTGRTTQIDFGQIVGAVGGIAAGNYVAAGIAAAGTLVNSGPIRQNVARSGNISGNTGFCGVLRPYIVINRGVQSLPEGYQTLNGYPSNITAKLSTLTGFTKISKIHLEGFSATEDELDEIERMLQEGVIL